MSLLRCQPHTHTYTPCFLRQGFSLAWGCLGDQWVPGIHLSLDPPSSRVPDVHHWPFHTFARQALHWMSLLPWPVHTFKITEAKPRKPEECRAVLVSSDIFLLGTHTAELRGRAFAFYFKGVCSPWWGIQRSVDGVDFRSQYHREVAGEWWLRREPTKTKTPTC